MGCNSSRELDGKRSIFIIRHGQSEYNVAKDKALAQNDDNAVQAARVNPELMDCSITKEGQLQAEECGKDLAEKNIKHVFVSPLRRALQTAQAIFKNHPNKPKLYADPNLTESLFVACDIGNSVDMMEKDFPEVDFTLVKELPQSHLWFASHIADPLVQSDLQEKLKQFEGNQEDETKFTRNHVLEMMKKSKSDTVESFFDLIKRTRVAKNKLRERIDKLPKGEDVCVVGHHVFLDTFTATVFQDTGFPADGVVLQNAKYKMFAI